MNPLLLLSSVPNVYKLLAVLVAVASLSTFCYVKGYRSAENAASAEVAEAYKRGVSEQKRLAEKDYEDARKAQLERDAALAKSSDINKRLAAELAKSSQYKSCKVSKEVKDLLNEALK